MDVNKLRWIVALAFVGIGGALVYTGHLTGADWASVVGGIFTGSGATLATAPKR